MPDIEVLPSETLSKDGEKRYIILNKATGEILDDAQGYGFRSRRKAYAAFTYKQYNGHMRNEQSGNNHE